MTFLDLAYETLKQVKVPLTEKQIWEKAQELKIDFKTNGATPWKTIGAKIYIDLKSNPHTKFYKVGNNPVTFFIKGIENNFLQIENTSFIEENKEETEKENKEEKETFQERDLHPLLTNFLLGNPNFSCYSRTVFHEKSQKGQKGKNEWLHPDIVSVYFPFDDFKDKTLQLITILEQSKFKLFSFEMKKNITFSNLREFYFQAVSNSSWANEGYLVALEYDSDPSLIDEMKRLNEAFGIGFIRLDKENIAQSDVLFQAKTNNQLDWTTINRLISTNPDFENFIAGVISCANGKEVNKKFFDKILTEEEIEKYLTKKKIN